MLTRPFPLSGAVKDRTPDGERGVCSVVSGLSRESAVVDGAGANEGDVWFPVYRRTAADTPEDDSGENALAP